MTRTFTKPQLKALERAFKGGAAYGGGRSGGAYFRMIARLIHEGLLDARPPFQLTTAGLHALRDAYGRRWAKYGCLAYLDDCKAVDAVIAKEEAVLAEREESRKALIAMYLS